jgi:hypothetical protein
VNYYENVEIGPTVFTQWADKLFMGGIAMKTLNVFQETNLTDDRGNQLFIRSSGRSFEEIVDNAQLVAIDLDSREVQDRDLCFCDPITTRAVLPRLENAWLMAVDKYNDTLDLTAEGMEY